MTPNKVLESIEHAARTAGELLLRRQSSFQLSEKGRFDLVTDADHAAQNAIREILHNNHPEIEFLGEETEHSEKELLLASNKPLWVVDPLDGTTNYVHGLPCYGVSIALVSGEQVLEGAIFDPIRQELFTARLGHGARLNGEAIHCSAANNLEQALIAVGFPADLRGKEEVLHAWAWFGYHCRGLRRTGSSALNLAYVAAGRLDGFFAFQVCPWDIAAGMLLVQEAGGNISQRDGSAYHPLRETVFVSSNGPLHDKILHGLNSLSPGTTNA
ncbi:MAG: inositol monophosphatase [Planctomycetia bacterium]|nr:inositol monophosphatase [Planctomycetia bacterium]